MKYSWNKEKLAKIKTDYLTLKQQNNSLNNNLFFGLDESLETIKEMEEIFRHIKK